MSEHTSNADLNAAALAYHALHPPGKLAVQLTKAAESQRDLTLAYSPGVAAPVRAIAEDPRLAYRYTNKGNLVAVISNGTAILGLGDLGALASKPVMEGKGLLFKKFAGIDVYDLEVNVKDPHAFIAIVEALAPTFGGINLEDIAAPECFVIEEALVEKLDIPVFHDDQHGTAIIVGAALQNALLLQEKTLQDVKVVILGAGASAIATATLLKRLGMPAEHILMVDRQGVIYRGRGGLNVYKERFAVATEARTLADACRGADVFIGLSGANLLRPEVALTFAERPVIFALSNPDPEIAPEVVKQLRPDAIMATGRSDYPNQVNNVLGFPFVFRGALAVQARKITPNMHLAAVAALQELSQAPVPESVCRAYGLSSLAFGRDYILPKPIDPRLSAYVATAVAKAAIADGVAGLTEVPLPIEKFV
jgi:malate dehydrogenase (oxaloacetate-decarboxylating)(NADP+)